MTINEYWHVDVFRAGLLSDMQFGADWTMYIGVPTNDCFLAKHVNSLEIYTSFWWLFIVKVFPIRCACLTLTKILAYRCLSAGSLIKQVKFGEYWIMYIQVTSISSFKAISTKRPPCQGHIVQWHKSFEQLAITKVLRLHSPNLKLFWLILSEEFVVMQFLKIAQNSKFTADFLLGTGHGSKRLICKSGQDSCAFQILYM